MKPAGWAILDREGRVHAVIREEPVARQTAAEVDGWTVRPLALAAPDSAFDRVTDLALRARATAFRSGMRVGEGRLEDIRKAFDESDAALVDLLVALRDLTSGAPAPVVHSDEDDEPVSAAWRGGVGPEGFESL